MLRYKDQQDSRYLHESLDMVRDTQQASYPNDLENLIHYLRINAKQGAGGGSSSAAVGVKLSSFAAKKAVRVSEESKADETEQK